jgi:hypothetical protein
MCFPSPGAIYGFRHLSMEWSFWSFHTAAPGILPAESPPPSLADEETATDYTTRICISSSRLKGLCLFISQAGCIRKP